MYNVSFEQLDVPYMCCHFFVHVTENGDFIGDYLIPDEDSAWYFCNAVRNKGLDFAVNEFGSHKMTAQDWEAHDADIRGGYIRVTIDVTYQEYKGGDTVCFALDDWQGLEWIERKFGADMVPYFSFERCVPFRLHTAMKEAAQVVQKLGYNDDLKNRTIQAIRNAHNEHDITRALITAREECA